MMKKFIIREDTIKSVRKALEGNKDVLHDFDTGLCTLSPYMPDHIGLGNKDCCGIFMGIDDDNNVICNECRMKLTDAISKFYNKAIKQLKEGEKEDCPVCHGQGRRAGGGG